MSIPYKTVRGNFKIDIIEKQNTHRDAYNDISIKFDVKVENVDNPEWIITFPEVIGHITRIEDKNKLVDKIVEEIKKRINLDQPGIFSIGDLTV